MEKTRFSAAAAANARAALFLSKTNGNSDKVANQTRGWPGDSQSNESAAQCQRGRLARHLKENVGRSSGPRRGESRFRGSVP